MATDPWGFRRCTLSGKGATQQWRLDKRARAEARNAKTPPERRRVTRLAYGDEAIPMNRPHVEKVVAPNG